MYRLSLQPLLLQPPIDLLPLHMPSGQPTRTPGTPVGELLARRPLHAVPSAHGLSLPKGPLCRWTCSAQTRTVMPRVWRCRPRLLLHSISLTKSQSHRLHPTFDFQLLLLSLLRRAYAYIGWTLAIRLISIFASMWYRILPLARVPRNRALGPRLVLAPSYWCARVFAAAGASDSNQSASA